MNITDSIERERLALKILEDVRENNPDFPYPHYAEKTLRNSYKRLKAKEFDDIPTNDSSCMHIIAQFHPSVFDCNVRDCPSPKEAYYDDELLFKVILNRLDYKGIYLTPSDLLRGFSVSRIAPKVSLFKPSIAKYLTEKYLAEFNVIFDPCCGYSGRMLGVCSSGRRYLGYDINDTTIEEARKIIDFLSLKAEVECRDSLEELGEFECLMTCPPYADKERWNQDIDTHTAEEWITLLLRRFNCKRYIFIVDRPGRYMDNVKETIENTSHFGTSREYVVVIERERATNNPSNPR